MNWETRLVFIIVLTLGYTWAGYPALLWALRKILGGKTISRDYQPTISIVVAVHNEETQIAAKLEDCLRLDYPRDHIEIVVASDGSTDSTEEIVQQYGSHDGRIRLLKSAGRAGKSGVQNLAVEHSGGEIVLFTDAETRAQPNLLRQIAEDFGDPRVGLVAPTVYFGNFDSAVAKGQGAYWRFELFLRQLESDLGILATASGAALAVRRTLFRPLPAHYGDDCVMPLDVRLQGYKVVQDPRAIVSDQMPCTIEGELRARVRMTARNWAGIFSRSRLLNPVRFPGTAWGLISHKFLRWMTPFFLAGAFLINGWLAAHGGLVPLLLVQSCFYLAALVGWRRSGRQRCERIFGYPFAFCLANLGFFLGAMRSLRGEKVIAYK